MAMTPELEDKIKKAFNLFDKNGDGTVSHSEVKVVMSELGEPMSDTDIKEMIASVDTSRDGVLSLSEFVKMMSNSSGRRTKLDPRAEIREMFVEYDKNGDGVITREELKKMLRMLGDGNLSEDAIEKLISSADCDDNGMIDFEEFVNLLD